MDFSSQQVEPDRHALATVELDPEIARLETMSQATEPAESLAPIRLFFSFAHQDDAYRIQLETHLRLLERQGLIAPWNFRKIIGGEDFAQVIDDQLARADVVVLLVSADFLASDYCYEVELATALRRHDAGEARVVPVLIRDCDWRDAPFARIQGLPTGFKPVSSWPNVDEAWADVARGLRKVVRERQGVAAVVNRALADAVASGDGPRVADPSRYLEALDAEHAYVEIRGMGAKVAERLPLDQVYTRLNVVGGTAPESASKDERQDLDSGFARDLSLRDVIRRHHEAVLIGDPGSGKTTFLRFAARMLARAHLASNPALAADHLGLTADQPLPLPVFVRLGELATFLDDHPDDGVQVDAPAHFDRYLDFLQAGHGYRLHPTYLRDEVAAGRALLLLDGLDEVPGTARERTARLVERVAVRGRRAGNRVLLTCRIRAYTERSQLAGLPSFRLAPFRPEQVSAFVRSWCLALFQARGDTVGGTATAAEQAEAYRETLWQAIRSHPNVQPLTENPLMLTVLAVVHWNERKLPEERVALYEAALGWLLDARGDAAGLPTVVRQEALQALAVRMFVDDEGVQRRLGRAEAAAAVAPVLEGEDVDPEAFLDQEALWSGVLVSRSAGEVEFWHLSFQEYLAALELRRDPDHWSILGPRIHDDRWSEVALLLGGCLRTIDGPQAVKRYIKRILATGEGNLPTLARAVGLIGRILRDIAPGGRDCAAGTGYAEALEMVMTVFQQKDEAVSEVVRVEVGEALGQAGDPRLVNELDQRALLPACTFLMGAQSGSKDKPGFDPDAYSDEQPVRAVELDAFAMSHYPVTVQAYAAFIQAGGYREVAHWDPMGWAWRDNEDMVEPEAWKEQKRYPNRPVTRVSWFEADAFSRWAGGALPTEAQWERAARGEAGKRYPWGNAAPSGWHASYDGRTKAATPVGIYPMGRTTEGIHDLAGNVWEWCADWFGAYPSSSGPNPTGYKEGTSRVLRGGSFVDDTRYLRGAYRLDYDPRDRVSYVGFRVVWRVSGGLN